MDDPDLDLAPLVRMLAMPSDANASGDIFGGWVMAQMDIAGGMAACAHAQGRTTTVAVKELRFIKPVKVGEVFSVQAWVERSGNTSVTVVVEARSAPRADPVRSASPVAIGTFIYVALDEAGNKRRFDL